MDLLLYILCWFFMFFGGQKIRNYFGSDESKWFGFDCGDTDHSDASKIMEVNLNSVSLGKEHLDSLRVTMFVCDIN